ncbi:hypothetical protein [Glutamicibacter arilaitensis]|uniref:hypothetical protein n=1 Tax=Glutamicibacter arilaitensis TaxID=256701 RepID=UPI003FD61FF9
MATTKARSASTKLEPGEDSIDRVSPWQDEVTKKWMLAWSVRLPNGKLVRRRTESVRKGDLRAKARAKAEEVLANAQDSEWKPGSELAKYINTVSRPEIEKANLRDRTKAQYLSVLRLVAGDCNKHGKDSDKQHSYSLKYKSIDDMKTIRVIERCLQEIAELHGRESAEQAKTVISKYIIQEMRKDALIDFNPMRGMDFKLRHVANVINPNTKKGGIALSRADYNRVIEFLLELDPVDIAPERTLERFKYLIPRDLKEAESVIDLTLLQATTGLRVTEANSLVWPAHVEIDKDQNVHISIDAEVSKTHRARRVSILDPRVAKRFIERKNKYPDSLYVIGSPIHQNKQWSRPAVHKVASNLYKMLAKTLKIVELENERTHIWRATLNTLLRDQISDVDRSAWFGHTVEVNRASYTDLSDTSAMLKASEYLRVTAQRVAT